MIQLSGGDFGGDFIKWTPTGVLDDGRETMVFNSLIYAKVSDAQAVFYGISDGL